MNKEQLKSAIQAGVIDEKTAADLISHLQADQQEPLTKTVTADDEQFRLVTGFNDIFVVIASLLLLISSGWLFGKVNPLLGGIASAAIAWGLSEYFVRKRHMALPAIVLLLAFVYSIYTGVLLFSLNGLPFYGAGAKNYGYTLGVPAILAALGAWLHWKRFQVPISIAAGVGSLALLIITLFPREFMLFAMFAFGLLTFALAIHWDAQDTQRITRKSDVAFWLHMLAAPMMVHPIFSALNILNGQISGLQAVTVLIMYIAIALISLIVDRRALMVSALGYVLFTFSKVINQLQSIETGFAITALIIGSGLLLLSAFWQQSRQFILKFVPHNFQQYIPRSNKE